MRLPPIPIRHTIKCSEKGRCSMNVRLDRAMSILLVLALALLMEACVVTSLNKLDSALTLTSEGGATIRDNGVDVITINAGDGHSLDAADGSLTDALFVTNDGNVGIGTVTPSETFSVRGTVESTSRGFKFPDGTVQTTAAFSNYQRVKQWAPGGILTLQPGDVKTVSAGCPQGMKALGGGGGFHQLSGPIAIIASSSYSGGTTWRVWFKNVGTTAGSADLYAEVICSAVD